MPDRRLPREAVPHLVPDLAVEVLSRSNTPTEMRRKLREYFQAGVRLVWYIDPASRTVTIYHDEHDAVALHEHEMLTGDEVLPGFELPVRQLFTPAAPQSSTDAPTR